MNKYAVKVMLAVDDWLYVTEDLKKCTYLEVKKFDTYQEAEDYAKIWKRAARKQITKVVEYAD